MGVGPAWATADQTVTVSAAITRDPTTDRRIVAFGTLLPPMNEALMSRDYPIIGAVGMNAYL